MLKPEGQPKSNLFLHLEWTENEIIRSENGRDLNNSPWISQLGRSAFKWSWNFIKYAGQVLTPSMICCVEILQFLVTSSSSNNEGEIVKARGWKILFVSLLNCFSIKHQTHHDLTARKYTKVETKSIAKP